MRGHADGSANVAAYAEISQARSKAGSASARRSARRSLHVPWIIRLAINRVIALPVRQRHGDISRAQQHRAGVREQMVHHVRVLRRFGITQRWETPCAWMTSHGKTFLYRDGNAVENAQGSAGRFALRERCISFFCLRQRVFTQLISKNIELRIVMINARKHALGEFDGRNFLRANGFRCLQGGGEVEFMRRGRRRPRFIRRCERRVLRCSDSISWRQSRQKFQKRARWMPQKPAAR